MKNFLIAAAMAVSSIVVAAPSSQAAGVTVVTDERPMPPRDRMHHPRRHVQRDDCRTKTVKTYRHGHMIVRKTQVCR